MTVDNRFQKIYEAQQALNKFLEENPHMRAEQDKLTQELKNIGSAHNRMALLVSLMQKNTHDLGVQLKALSALFGR